MIVCGKSFEINYQKLSADETKTYNEKTIEQNKKNQEEVKK